MEPLPHHYQVQLHLGPSGYAELSTPGAPVLNVAPPSEYGGPGNAWSPEHLLLAAVQACFLFTLRAIARNSEVQFVTFDLEATGTVEREGGVTRFSEIVLKPSITVPATSDARRILRILEKTERNCLVSASLNTRVRLEPQITPEHIGVGD